MEQKVNEMIERIDKASNFILGKKDNFLGNSIEIDQYHPVAPQISRNVI